MTEHTVPTSPYMFCKHSNGGISARPDDPPQESGWNLTKNPNLSLSLTLSRSPSLPVLSSLFPVSLPPSLPHCARCLKNDAMALIPWISPMHPFTGATRTVGLIAHCHAGLTQCKCSMQLLKIDYVQNGADCLRERKCNILKLVQMKTWKDSPKKMILEFENNRVSSFEIEPR